MTTKGSDRSGGTAKAVAVQERQKVLSYKPRTDAEITQLAIDVLAGTVYGTWNQRVFDEIETVFLVLAFAGKDLAKELERDDILHVYEHISQAGPRSVNGLPSFLSCKFLSRDDSKRLHIEIDRLRPAPAEQPREVKPS